MNKWLKYGILLLLPIGISMARADTHQIAPLPADSVYLTPLTLRDQTGQVFTLTALRGHPVIVSMIYASCQSACPMTVETIKRIRTMVTARTRHPAPRVVLVSFDPARDTVQQLAMMASMHHVSAPIWRFVRPEQGDVRAFAATLGVSWRTRSSGDISHNVEIVLLDADGRIVAKTGQTGAPEPGFVDSVSRAGN